MIISFETFIKVINHFKFDVWVIVGFLGQLFFSMRFIIQWIKSEKEKQSIVPYSFWIFSILGSGILLIYAIKRRDPVFVIGQASGFIIYIRNIQLIKKNKNKVEAENV